MPDELQVRVPGCDALAPATKSALHQKVTEYGQTLFREAERLESMNRSHSGPAQITVVDVDDANTLLRRGRVVPKRDYAAVILNGASALAALLAGYFVNHTDKPWGVIGLVVCATITVGCGVAGYMR